MKRPVACTVIALALFATALTRSASADRPADAPASSVTTTTQAAPAATPTALSATPAAPSAAPDVPAQPVGTPLPVRPSAPLVLEPAPSGPGFGWKVLALMAAAGCGLWVWKKRMPGLAEKRLPELRIVGRTSAGPRCELLLVELEGQRLLLGVTPQSIQNLYIVPEPAPEEPTVEVKESASGSVKRTKNLPQTAEAIEGQARGLLGSGERL